MNGENYPDTIESTKIEAQDTQEDYKKYAEEKTILIFKNTLTSHKPFVQSTNRRSVAVIISEHIIVKLKQLYNIDKDQFLNMKIQEYLCEIDGKPAILIKLP